jgi:D-alanyl-D-alanine dipeptidase
MTTTSPSAPAPFTRDDFAERMSRVANSAVEEGLAGVIVTPSPDLIWLLGYCPTSPTLPGPCICLACSECCHVPATGH